MAHEHKQAEIDSRTAEFMADEATKPFGWDPAHFIEWATIEEMLRRAGVAAGARVLDVGCGNGWTTLFLAEAGLRPLGIDLVPANVELARQRAERWGSSARFAVQDMEALAVPELVEDGPFDAALVFDSLHHVRQERNVFAGIAACLRPGGWLLLGEPTWLHYLSPNARRVQRELGWLERGFTLRGLRRDLAATGFVRVQRLFQGSAPYSGFGVVAQVARLLGARVLAAPQHHIWLMAQKPS